MKKEESRAKRNRW